MRLALSILLTQLGCAGGQNANEGKGKGQVEDTDPLDGDQTEITDDSTTDTGTGPGTIDDTGTPEEPVNVFLAFESKQTLKDLCGDPAQCGLTNSVIDTLASDVQTKIANQGGDGTTFGANETITDGDSVSYGYQLLAAGAGQYDTAEAIDLLTAGLTFSSDVDFNMGGAEHMVVSTMIYKNGQGATETCELLITQMNSDPINPSASGNVHIIGDTSENLQWVDVTNDGIDPVEVTGVDACGAIEAYHDLILGNAPISSTTGTPDPVLL